MWLLPAAHFLVLMAAAGLLIAAAASDARHYRIPNLICAALVALFPIFVLTSPHAVEWEQNLIVFGLALGAGLVMFFLHMVGAGDVKLLAAAGLWAGPHFAPIFFLATALAGGVVALVMVLLTFVRNRKRDVAIPVGKAPIPYGIAIAFGGLIIVYQLSEPIFFSS